MGKQRGVLRALVMGAIPLLHIFLFYKWCNEAKVKWKTAGLNATLYTAMFAVPLLNIYPLYRLLSLIEANLAKEKKKAYILKPLYLSVLMYVAFPLPLLLGTLICPILLLAVIVPVTTWLYIVYKTQSLFNANGVASL